MNIELNDDEFKNIHQLCIAQSQSLFLDVNNRIVNTAIDINDDDARRYKLSPLIVVIIAVQGTGIYDAKMFPSTLPVDIGGFIRDVWLYNYNFRGVPEKIYIDRELDDSIDFRSVVSLIAGVDRNVEVDTSGGRSFAAVKRRAKELAECLYMKNKDFSQESIFRYFELLGESGYSPSAFKNIDRNNALDVVNLNLKRQMLNGIRSNSVRFDTKRPNVDRNKIKLQSTLRSSSIKKTPVSFLVDVSTWVSKEVRAIPSIKEYQRLEIGLGEKFARADVTSGQYISRWLEPHNESIPEEIETSWVGHGLREAIRCLVGRYPDQLLETHRELAEFIAGRGSLPVLTWRKIYWDIMNRDCVFVVQTPTDLRKILGLFDAKECTVTYLIYSKSSGARELSYLALFFPNGIKVFAIGHKCLATIKSGKMKSVLNNAVQIDYGKIKRIHSAFSDHSKNINVGAIFYELELLVGSS